MLPADHHIARPAAFRDALAAAAELAERGAIATIGIRPSRPETGYGYLKLGPRARRRGRKGSGAAHKVERFVEKPDVVTAARYLADGGYLWNSGIFAFRADVILEEIRRAMPVLGEQLDAIAARARDARVPADARARLPGVPLDLDRLRRDGEVDAHRRRPGRLRLVRRRQLRGALRRAPDRPPRQRRRGRRDRPRRAQRGRAREGRAAGRGGRASTTSSWSTPATRCSSAAATGPRTSARRSRSSRGAGATRSSRAAGRAARSRFHPRRAVPRAAQHDIPGHARDDDAEALADDLPRVRHPRPRGPGPHRGGGPPRREGARHRASARRAGARRPSGGTPPVRPALRARR